MTRMSKATLAESSQKDDNKNSEDKNSPQETRHNPQIILTPLLNDYSQPLDLTVNKSCTKFKEPDKMCDKSAYESAVSKTELNKNLTVESTYENVSESEEEQYNWSSDSYESDSSEGEYLSESASDCSFRQSTKKTSNKQSEKLATKSNNKRPQSDKRNVEDEYTSIEDLFYNKLLQADLLVKEREITAYEDKKIVIHEGENVLSPADIISLQVDQMYGDCYTLSDG